MALEKHKKSPPGITAGIFYLLATALMDTVHFLFHPFIQEHQDDAGKNRDQGKDQEEYRQ